MLNQLKSSTRPYGVVLLISVICVLLHFLPWDTSLAYRRGAIDQGEWWRLVTGNLLHTNHWHLLMNLAGLWVICFLHEIHYRAGNFALLFILLCIFQGVGLYYGYPSLYGYVGLSGMLHGLFAYGALKDIQAKIRSGYLLFAGVCAKVAYEQIYGATDEITKLIDARVATEAHLIGVISGILLFILFYSVRRITR